MIKIYDKNVKARYEASDSPITIVGGLLLWVGWLFFNTVSTFEAVDITK